MDEVRELGVLTEDEGRRLLAAAFETAPLGEALADSGLLVRVRRRDARRQRVRTLVPAGAVAAAAGAVALGVTLTATVADAPSAFAAVSAAAAKTSAVSFRFSAVTVTRAAAGVPQPPLVRRDGVFDPARQVGAEWMAQFPRAKTATANGATPASGGEQGPRAEIRFIRGHMYSTVPAGAPYTHGKPWVESRVAPPLPTQPLKAVTAGGTIARGFDGDQPIDPAALLGLLKSAASVRDEGPASGPGWTGTRYGFTMRLPKGESATVRGTVDVDNQGRVRQLVTTTALGPHASLVGPATITTDVTFGGFGVPVSVTPPPASQTYDMGNVYLAIAF